MGDSASRRLAKILGIAGHITNPEGYIVVAMLPEFMIIGSMKCGTSALARAITRHPYVTIAKGKELHYFDSNYSKGLDWFLSNFPPPQPGYVRGEATPYLGHRTAMDRLAETLPESRMVAILRQPADRAYSHYWHNRRRDREPLSFAEALAAEEGRPGGGEGIFGYAGLGYYGAHLSGLLQKVPRAQLLVVLNEDLRDDRDKTLVSVWEHIGVSPEDGDVSPVSRSRRKTTLRRFKGRIKGRADEDDERYPPLDPEVRGELSARFQQDIRRLESILERDLSSWD